MVWLLIMLSISLLEWAQIAQLGEFRLIVLDFTFDMDTIVIIKRRIIC